MIVKPIKTRILLPSKDDLFDALAGSLRELEEKSVVAIASKVVSIWQGRCIASSDVFHKDVLIAQEADKYLPRELVPGKWVMHTMKNNLLIPSAGIDESNGNGYYILWPSDPYGAARGIRTWFKREYSVAEVGVLIVDSHSIPLRRGALGISLAHAGFEPLNDYRGDKDLFGRELKASIANLADGLAAAAVTVMGEGSETTPCAVITDVPFVRFLEEPRVSRQPNSSFEVNEKEDLYYPFLEGMPWEKGGKEKEGV